MITRWFCVVVLQMLAVTFHCCADDRVDTGKSAVGDPFDRSGEEAVLAAIAKGNLTELKRLESVVDQTNILNLGHHTSRIVEKRPGSRKRIKKGLLISV